jgi:hypothetical protein
LSNFAPFSYKKNNKVGFENSVCNYQQNLKKKLKKHSKFLFKFGSNLMELDSIKLS